MKHNIYNGDPTMSRGFGKLETEILSTMDESKTFGAYRGGNQWTDHQKRWPSGGGGPGWLVTRGITVQIAPEVFDLYAVARIMANRRSMDTITGAFQAGFSRAVKSLIRRGALVARDAIPLMETRGVTDRNALIGREQHGAKRRTLKAEKQIRFVESGFTSYVRPHEPWDKPYLPSAEQRMTDYYLSRVNDPDERWRIEKRLRMIESEKRAILLDLKLRPWRQP